MPCSRLAARLVARTATGIRGGVRRATVTAHLDPTRTAVAAPTSDPVASMRGTSRRLNAAEGYSLNVSNDMVATTPRADAPLHERTREIAGPPARPRRARRGRPTGRRGQARHAVDGLRPRNPQARPGRRRRRRAARLPGPGRVQRLLELQRRRGRDADGARRVPGVRLLRLVRGAHEG